MDETRKAISELDLLLFHVAEPVCTLVAVINDEGLPVIETQYVKTSAGNIKRDTPTHTLLFAVLKDHGIVLMTYAKPNLGLGDNYSRKRGRELVTARMVTLYKKLEEESPIEAVPAALVNIIPQKIVDSLDHYLEKVSNYYRLDGTENVVFVGDSRTREEVITNQYGPKRLISVSNIIDEYEEVESGEAVTSETSNTNVTPEVDTVTEMKKQIEDAEDKKYIFCTTNGKDYDDDTAILIIVQNREQFIKENIVDLSINDELVYDIGGIMNDYDFYCREDSITFYSNKHNEDAVIHMLKDKGLGYSPDLEAVYLAIKPKTHEDISKEITEAKASIWSVK